MKSLAELLAVPDNLRDRSWENQFFVEFTDSMVNLVSDGPQQGPDGWPYLLVDTKSGAAEPVQKILHWLSEKGVGLALNPGGEYPDYVFP